MNGHVRKHPAKLVQFQHVINGRNLKFIVLILIVRSRRGKISNRCLRWEWLDFNDTWWTKLITNKTTINTVFGFERKLSFWFVFITKSIFSYFYDGTVIPLSLFLTHSKLCTTGSWCNFHLKFWLVSITQINHLRWFANNIECMIFVKIN